MIQSQLSTSPHNTIIQSHSSAPSNDPSAQSSASSSNTMQQVSISFNFTNDRPIYLQLVEQLELYIISGQFPPGSKLPSVRDFASAAQVNPNTMQKALAELEDKRLIITERTNGKFVTDDSKFLQKQRDYFAHIKIQKFLSEMHDLGFSHRDIIHHLQKLKRK